MKAIRDGELRVEFRIRYSGLRIQWGEMRGGTFHSLSAYQMWMWASLEKDSAIQVDGWICHIRGISRTSICEGADKIAARGSMQQKIWQTGRGMGGGWWWWLIIVCCCFAGSSSLQCNFQILLLSQCNWQDINRGLSCLPACPRRITLGIMSKLSVKWHLGFMYTHRHTRRHTHTETHTESRLPKVRCGPKRFTASKASNNKQKARPIDTLLTKGVTCQVCYLIHTLPPLSLPPVLCLFFAFFCAAKQTNKTTKQLPFCCRPLGPVSVWRI